MKGERITVPDPFLTPASFTWETNGEGKCILRDTNGAIMLELVLGLNRGFFVLTDLPCNKLYLPHPPHK